MGREVRNARAIRGLGLAFGALLAGAALAAPDAAMQERIAPCIACHGAGTSPTEGVPSLGGQPADYVVTQLFQFREGQRAAPPMNDMAAGFSDDDLQDLRGCGRDPAGAHVVGAACRRGARRPGAGADFAKRQCNSCHGADLAGRDAIPRIRGQREEYLATALAGYKSNARPGYDPAMNEVAQELSPADIKDLAAYVSRL